MCGIIGYVGNRSPRSILMEGLKRLEYRGYDSAGIAVLEKGQLEVYRSEGRIQALEEKLGTREFESGIGIGHTRWATHGVPAEVNAHPHRIGSVTLVHNGIIENYMHHKAEIQKLGREIFSDTDTEIVAHLVDIELNRGKSLKDAVIEVLPKLQGTYSFVLMRSDDPDEIVGVKNGAPLLVGVGENENFLASDVQAVLSHTKEVIYLKDKEFAICRDGGIEVFSEKGTPISYETKSIDWTPDQLEMQGYKHYMLKEIYEQPQALANTIEGNIDHKQGIVRLSDLSISKEKLKNVDRVSIAACGTALYAGLVGKYYLERFAGVSAEVDFASEFRYRDPVLSDNSLCLFISQSGETADTLAALNGAKEKKCSTLAVCNVRDSSIAREAESVIYTNAGPEIGVASTKAFTTQLALLYMFAVELGEARGHLSTEQAVELTNELLHAPILLDKALQLDSKIEAFTSELEGYSDFFFVGRGLLYPIALEGALKLKEISYLHAEGYPAGELKHGPIALIDKKMVTVAAVPKHRPYKTLFSDQRSEFSALLYDKMQANIQEVKARRGKIITLGTEGDEIPDSWFHLQAPEATWGINPILLAVPLQLFAYYIALQRGTDIDKPRNLAKSVTVE